MSDATVVTLSQAISPPIVFFISVITSVEALLSNRRGWFLLAVAWFANFLYIRFETTNYTSPVTYLGHDFLLLNLALLTATFFLAYGTTVLRPSWSTGRNLMIAGLAGGVVAIATGMVSQLSLSTPFPVLGEDESYGKLNSLILTPLIVFSFASHSCAAVANWKQVRQIDGRPLIMLVPFSLAFYAVLQLTYYSKAFSPLLFTAMLTLGLVVKVVYAGGLLVLVKVGMEERQQNIIRKEQFEDKQRSFAIFAHEVKNPAHVLNNRADTVQRLLLTKNYSKAAGEVEKLVRETELLVYVVDSLKIAAERLPLSERTVISLNEVIDTSLLQVRQQLPYPQTWVRKDYGKNVDIKGIANPMAQVFTNIIRNSLEACDGMPEESFALTNGVRLRIRTRRSRISVAGDRDKREIAEVLVVDYGPGIPTEVRDLIFEPYFSTKTGTNRGLGLWVAKNFVRDFDGQILVETPIERLKRGTIIELSFPAEIVDRSSSSGSTRF